MISAAARTVGAEEKKTGAAPLETMRAGCCLQSRRRTVNDFRIDARAPKDKVAVTPLPATLAVTISTLRGAMCYILNLLIPPNNDHI